jgi:hypothetical protein
VRHGFEKPLVPDFPLAARRGSARGGREYNDRLYALSIKRPTAQSIYYIGASH